MLIDLVIVTPPKPPGSSTLISPPVGGLRNRAGEGLAWRRAAAGIRVVAHAGDPGSGGLRVHYGGKADYESRS